jgi:hypothetical protein
MNSASLCSLAGQYDNTIPPRFLAPIDSIKIPAQYANPSMVNRELIQIHVRDNSEINKNLNVHCTYVDRETDRKTRASFTLLCIIMSIWHRGPPKISSEDEM